MTTWPVNYIEQDMVYRRLLAAYEQKLIQATGVLIHSFTEPTQEEWEDAYVQQTGGVPPIIPGKLRWLDLKNGSVKSYTTIYKDGGVEIDPVVRPLADRDAEWGCIRLLARVHAIPEIGIPLDTTTWINKGLLMLIVFSDFTNVPIIADSGFINYTVTRNGSAAPSTGSETGTVTSQYQLIIFNPSTERVGDELIPRNSAVSTWSSTANSGSPGVLQIGVGVHSTRAMQDLAGFQKSSSTDRLVIYGVFADDPGYIEEFEL
jgi:hypothetical protein